MKISYNSSIQDISAYGKLVYEKSPTVKAHLKKTYYFSVPMLIIFAAIIKYFGTTDELLMAWAALGVGWLIYLPSFHKKKYLKKFIASFEDEKYQNLFGKHELTIEENILTDTIELRQNNTEISKIEHVEVTDDYAFIFIDSAMAYLIPENDIISGDLNNFIKTLKDTINSLKKD